MESVESVQKHGNREIFSKYPFFSAKVRTFGGELDVVAHPVAVKGKIKKKEIVGQRVGYQEGSFPSLLS